MRDLLCFGVRCVDYAEVTAHAMSLHPGADFLGDFERHGYIVG